MSPGLRRRALVRRIGPAGRAVDLRSVAAALAGRADIGSWLLEVGHCTRDGRAQLLAHFTANADPADVAVDTAADVRAAAGALPDQFVAAEGGRLPAVEGDRLSRRIVVRS
jgi:hypothetical protein